MDLQEIYKRCPGGDSSGLTYAELQFVARAELSGGFAGGMPLEQQYDRERALDSPSFLATEIIDPFYKKHFETVHYQMMDEVMAPYLLGETLKLEGQSHNPSDYLGLLILFSRNTFKSTITGMMVLWNFLQSKIRLGVDARTMYVHQVIDKAVERGDVIRNIARHNKKFRACFPEFAAREGEWDTQKKWRWPNFSNYTATEFSFIAYGESSDKTGGHYTLRAVDDWETEGSVTTEQMLAKSHSSFRMMDNLKVSTQKFNPYLICGTNYHHQGTHKKLENDGGYLVWRMPAHTGSPKRIFDLCSLDPRTEKGRLKIKAGIRRLETDPPGKLNFPKMLPWEELYRMARAQGAHIYNTQQLLDPTPEGDQRFPQDAIDEMRVTKIPGPDEMWIYIRVDPAISEKKINDETAIRVGGVDWRAWRYFIDGWSGREKRPSEIVRKCFAFARKWQSRGYKVRNIGFESVSYQEALAQTARDGVPEREAREHGEEIKILKAPCPVRSITRSNAVRKEERILEMEPFVSRREVKVWDQDPDGEKFINQLKNFPHDRKDLLDAAHDLWVATLVPPRPQSVSTPNIPVWMNKYLKRVQVGAIEGLNNTIRLEARR